jgi:hypothetical protein
VRGLSRFSSHSGEHLGLNRAHDEAYWIAPCRDPVAGVSRAARAGQGTHCPEGVAGAPLDLPDSHCRGGASQPTNVKFPAGKEGPPVTGSRSGITETHVSSGQCSTTRGGHLQRR